MDKLCSGGLSVESAYQKAVKAIRDGQAEEFESTLEELKGKVLIQKELLEIAIKEGNTEFQPNFVTLLLNNTTRATPAIFHLAAQCGRTNILKILIKHEVPPNALSTSGETGLHSALRGVEDKRSTSERALEVIKFLVEEYNVNVDVRDDVGGWTAVHLAANFKQWNIVQYFLDKDAHIDVKVFNKTARDVIKKEHTLAQLVETYPMKPDLTEDAVTKLFRYIDENNVDDFMKTISIAEGSTIIGRTKGRMTLLQAAAEKGLVRIVEKLLQMGANVNQVSGIKHSPVILATDNGHADILEVLLNDRYVDLTLVEGDHKFTALHTAVLSKRSSIRCLELLLNSKNGKLDINAQDYRDFTALHYAAKGTKTDAVKLLLRNKAKIFFLYDQNKPLLYDIKPELIMEYLDHHVTFEGESISHENYALCFDYSFLGSPTNSLDTEQKSDLPPKVSNSVEIQMPTSCRDCCKSHELSNETKALLVMAKSEEHKVLLNHPLIKSYLQYLWHGVSCIFFINLIVFVLFTASLTAHVIYRVDKTNTTSQESTGNNASEQFACTKSFHSSSPVTRIVTTIFLLLISLREVAQFMSSAKQYFKDFDNYVELVLVLVSFLLLWVSPFCNNCLNPHALAVSAVLLAYFELIRLLGRHPRVATYFTMFFRVCRTFFYFLWWYILIVFAFGVCFYIVFPGCKETDNGQKEENVFSHPGTSIFKTLVMVSGELEAGDIDFGFFNGLSHIIFISFIFFIPIVMVNLLNGLAVSDIQAIRNEAEVVSCVSQVELFAKIESTNAWKYLSRHFKFLSPKLPGKQLKVFLNDNNRLEPNLQHMWGSSCYDQLDTCCACNTCSNLCETFNTVVRKAREAAAQREQLSEREVMLQKLNKLDEKIAELTQAFHSQMR